MIKLIFSLLMISLSVHAGLPPTTSKVSGDTSDKVSFNFRFPNFTGTRTGSAIQLDVNSIAGGGTGQTTKAAAFDALSPMTTSGDLIYGGTSGAATRLPKGSDGSVLKLTSGLPTWGSFTSINSPGATLPTLCGALVTSAGVITKQYGGCIASVSSSVTYTVTFTSSYWADTPICTAIAHNGAGYDIELQAASTTSISVRTMDTASGAATNQNFMIICFGPHT